MMVLKKKEVIAAALVVLIGVAGYLNWSYQDTVRVTDGSVYNETAKRLGEAQYVSSPKKDVEDNSAGEASEKADAKSAEEQDKKSAKADKSDKSDKNDKADKNDKSGKSEKSTETSANEQFAAARLEKENARSKSLEILNQTAANESFDDDTRKKAQDRILKLAENVEKEATIENIAKAKGFSEIAVYIDGDAVDMLVKKADLSENDVVKLKEIAAEQLNIGAKDIKIVQVQ